MSTQTLSVLLLFSIYLTSSFVVDDVTSFPSAVKTFYIGNHIGSDSSSCYSKDVSPPTPRSSVSDPLLRVRYNSSHFLSSTAIDDKGDDVHRCRDPKVLTCASHAAIDSVPKDTRVSIKQIEKLEQRPTSLISNERCATNPIESNGGYLHAHTLQIEVEIYLWHFHLHLTQ
jgi:hypothetical protein